MEEIMHCEAGGLVQGAMRLAALYFWQCNYFNSYIAEISTNSL